MSVSSNQKIALGATIKKEDVAHYKKDGKNSTGLTYLVLVALILVGLTFTESTLGLVLGLVGFGISLGLISRKVILANVPIQAPVTPPPKKETAAS